LSARGSARKEGGDGGRGTAEFPLGLAVLLLTPTVAAVGEAPPVIGWQEAVARLAAERTRAETCAGLLKRHGDEAARSRGALAYGGAKAEVDAVIAGLVVALAQGATPASLSDLEARLTSGVRSREAFCAGVLPLVPAATGERGVLADLAAGVFGPAAEVVKALVLDARETDRLTRKTVQTQLEAATWPAFAAVPPAP
jgi:hypothetical protein